MKINNIYGPPVEGEDFFGREKELNFAWAQIINGNSLILSAPRRVGKSSFAKKLVEKSKQEGWNFFEIDLEEIASEISFVRLFVEKLENSNSWERIKSKTGNVIGQILEGLKPSIELDEVKMNIEWKSKKVDVYQKLKSLLVHEENTLIIVDELTVLLNSLLQKESGIQDVEFFLNWLRSFRQISGTKIRWVFCSSVGIDNFTNMHSLSHTLNDVSTFPLDAFERIEAERFIKELAKSEKLPFTQVEIGYMLDKLQWNLPFFIQILFSNINQLIKIHGELVSNETIDMAYEQLISEKHLNTWDERLKEYGRFEKYTRMVLENLSSSKLGASRDVLFSLLYGKINDEDKTKITLSKILRMLQNDGYLIIKQDGKYVFRSPLLRDFWYNRFVR